MEGQEAQAPLGAIRLALQSFVEPFRHPGEFIPVFVVGAILYVSTTLLSPEFDPEAPPPALAPLLTTWAASLVVGVLFLGWASVTTADALTGNARSIAERAALVIRNLPPLLVFFILVALLTMVGMLLLVLPGLYVMALFLPWIVTTAFEGRGWSGLDRAMALTKGYRWSVVGAILVLFVTMLVVVFAVSSAIVPALAPAPEGDVAEVIALPIGALVVLSLLALYMEVVSFAVLPVKVYLRLREIKEGVSGSDLLAEAG
jgi:hypothetical protein